MRFLVVVLLLVPSLVALGGSARDDRHQGWLVHHAGGGRGARVVAPTASFAVEKGESIHPNVGPRDWDARFTGAVEVRDAGRHRFGIEAEGGWAELSVSDAEGRLLTFFRGVVDGTVHLGDWVDLEQGECHVLVRFRRRNDDRCRMRTFWEREFDERGGFRAEPIPSSFVRVPAAAREHARRDVERFRGRVMLETKGCTRCHEPGASTLHAVGSREGPDLDGVGARASRAWIERWLVEPGAVRTGADMPALLDAETDTEDARALAALLSPDAYEPVAPTGDPVRGRALFHTVGCVACHGALATVAELTGDEFQDGTLPDADVHAPFGDLAGKWGAGELAGFLRAPHEAYPDGRMPSSSLTADEADDLAAYLVGAFGPRTAQSAGDGGLAARGRALFARHGCGRCHARAGVEPPTVEAPAPRFLDPDAGCLDAEDALTPRYDLDEADRAALSEALREVQVAVGVPSSIDAARRRMAVLGCDACHERDGTGGVVATLDRYFVSSADEVDLGDEGRLPPTLTDVGAHLTQHWIERVLTTDDRARPYLAARMPRHAPELVRTLGGPLARESGLWPGVDVEPVVDDERVRTGRELMGRRALGCVACHVYRDHPPSGTPGLAIDAFAERLRYEWYRRFVATPQRYRPGGRMPDFGRGGTSTLPDVYGGDMAAQADAMWAYFTLGEFMPTPPGVEREQGLAIEVGERPVVLRSFLPRAGARGIAVGTPLGVHYSFDAGAVRLVDAWLGDFLDASGSWANRGGTTVGGLGPLAWEAPPGPAIVLGERPEAWPDGPNASYRGYRLVADGAPEFLWRVGGHDVAERVSVSRAPSPRLERELSIRPAPSGPLWVRTSSANAAVRSADGEVEPADGSGSPRAWRVTPHLGLSGDLRVHVTEHLE